MSRGVHDDPSCSCRLPMSTVEVDLRPFGLKDKSLLKNSPVSAYDSRFGPQKTDSEPLELHYAPINVPGSSFSTG